MWLGSGKLPAFTGFCSLLALRLLIGCKMPELLKAPCITEKTLVRAR